MQGTGRAGYNICIFLVIFRRVNKNVKKTNYMIQGDSLVRGDFRSNFNNWLAKGTGVLFPRLIDLSPPEKCKLGEIDLKKQTITEMC